MPLERQQFRNIVGAFPTGVAVVTTVDPEGVPRGLTTQSFTSVSTDPPLVLVCIDKSSRTLPALLHSRAFAINFLSAGREALSNRFASKEPDKFAGLSFRPSSVAKGAPIFHEDIVACAECNVTQTV